MNDVTVKLFSKFHTVLYRLTGGRVGHRFVHNDMCLLTTTGARNGRSHTVPLLYLEDGDRLVLIASYGGRTHHPDWYHNLVEHPSATVQILTERRPVTARTADGEERVAWWPRIVAAYPDYAVYQSRTNREIPVVILDPRNSQAPG